MKNIVLELPAKYLMGRGIDKRFPFLVTLYKWVSVAMASDGVIEVAIPEGAKLLVSNKDAGLGLMLRMQHVFEPLQTKHFVKNLHSGDIFIDIGANIGYYTVLAGKKVGKNGKILAFEPDRENFKILTKNIRLNNLTNVHLNRTALGVKNGFVTFYRDDANPGESGLSKKSQKGVRVAMKQLNKFARSLNRSTRVVVKMDVEGAEMGVVNGGAHVLKKTNALYMECNPEALSQFGTSYIDLVTKIQEFGLQPKVIIDERGKRVIRYSAKTLQSALEKSSFVTIYFARL